MRNFRTSLLIALVVLTLQGYAKERVLSAELLHDTFVSLGYETANGFIGENDEEAFLSARILPQDRQALANLRAALQNWKRYIIVANPHDAQLLIAVRWGHVASANGGVQIGNIPVGVPSAGTRGTAVGPVYGAEVGPADDYLAVYQANQGHEGPNLWRHTEDGGLAGKNPPLFESFKKDIEALAKKLGKH